MSIYLSGWVNYRVNHQLDNLIVSSCLYLWQLWILWCSLGPKGGLRVFLLLFQNLTSSKCSMVVRRDEIDIPLSLSVYFCRLFESTLFYNFSFHCGNDRNYSTAGQKTYIEDDTSNQTSYQLESSMLASPCDVRSQHLDHGGNYCVTAKASKMYRGYKRASKLNHQVRQIKLKH